MAQTPPNPIKVCFFPGRETNYSRNRVLTRAMAHVGLTVYDCSYPKRTWVRNIVSFFKFFKNKGKCDIIFVGFLGQFIMPFVKLCTRKKIIFDAFLSVYQTSTADRETIKSNSPLAHFARFVDRFSCRLADVVLLDTNQDIDFFVEEFKLDRSKFQRMLVGSDDSIMYPRDNQPHDEFIVHFHGEFQPLHGTDYIMEAAKLLPDVRFQLIGKGPHFYFSKEYAQTNQLTNITFIEQVPYEELPLYMAKASICLGLLGNTKKTQLVIPHKAYEALAMAKPLITADTPAARELLEPGTHAILCRAADPQALADAIVDLKNHPEKRKEIAANGHNLFNKLCTPRIIGNQILNIASELLGKNP